jgi:hypothetical protein
MAGSALEVALMAPLEDELEAALEDELAATASRGVRTGMRKRTPA